MFLDLIGLGGPVAKQLIPKTRQLNMLTPVYERFVLRIYRIATKEDRLYFEHFSFICFAESLRFYRTQL